MVGGCTRPPASIRCSICSCFLMSPPPPSIALCSTSSSIWPPSSQMGEWFLFTFLYVSLSPSLVLLLTVSFSDGLSLLYSVSSCSYIALFGDLVIHFIFLVSNGGMIHFHSFSLKEGCLVSSVFLHSPLSLLGLV